MPTATFRLYAELNDFLPGRKKQGEFQEQFSSHETLKHILESLGVPHPEIDLILVNGRSRGFDERIQEGDRVSVYPLFRNLPVGKVSQVRPHPVPEPKFLLDNHLGKLARYLRLLGFDAAYQNHYDDHELARMAAEQERIMLTRDRGLLKRNQVSHGFILRSDDPLEQAVSVVRRYQLLEKLDPFTRCANCNGLLEPVSKGEVLPELEPLTKKYYHRFQRCRGCGQVYWEGTHFRRLNRFVKEIKGRAADPEGRREDFKLEG